MQFIAAMLPLAVQFGHLQNSVITTDRIMAAVNALSDTEASPSGKTSAVGVPLLQEQIERHMLSTYPNTNLHGDQLKKCLLREVDCGRLVQLMNSAYVLTDRVDKTMKIKREAVAKLPPKSTMDKREKKKLKMRKRLMKQNSIIAPEIPEEPTAEPEDSEMKKVCFGFSRGFPGIHRKFHVLQKKLRSAKLDLALRKKPMRHCLECVDFKGMNVARSGELLECLECNYASK